MTESEFQQRVIDLAKLQGWYVHHVRPARTANGWRTAVQGHSGFPDLVLAKPGHLIIAELKSARGRLGPGQRQWLEALAPHARIWRPDDWDVVRGHIQHPEAWLWTP